MPTAEYIRIAVAYIGAMFASNVALNYVSYPTQVYMVSVLLQPVIAMVQALAKCCKLIPVMAMGILINGKRYKVKQKLPDNLSIVLNALQLREYVNVALITLGIVCFNMLKTSDKVAADEPASSWMGLGLLFLSLALDG